MLRYSRGAKQGGVGGVSTPPEFWMGGLNTCQPPLILRKIFLGGVGSPEIDLTIWYMYFYLHRNSKKWTFYSVKFLKCESFLSALRRNSKKGPFL